MPQNRNVASYWLPNNKHPCAVMDVVGGGARVLGDHCLGKITGGQVSSAKGGDRKSRKILHGAPEPIHDYNPGNFSLHLLPGFTITITYSPPQRFVFIRNLRASLRQRPNHLLKPVVEAAAAELAAGRMASVRVDVPVRAPGKPARSAVGRMTVRSTGNSYFSAQRQA
jgi:hypothetical protein